MRFHQPFLGSRLCVLWKWWKQAPSAEPSGSYCGGQAKGQGQSSSCALTIILAATNERNLEFSPEKEEDEEDVPAEKPKLSISVSAASSVVDNTSKGQDIGYVAAKTVLDVFDGSLKELRMTIKGDGSSGNELTGRWQEQRLAELGVFARH